MASNSGNGGGAADYGLLPRDGAFSQSLPAFLLPYLAYVALASLPHRFLSPAAAEGFRFAAVAALLLAFRRRYRLGPPPTLRQAAAGIAVGAAGLVLWVLLYRSVLALPFDAFRTRFVLAAAVDRGAEYAVLRTLNSVLLVPLFEELFCRVWVAELMAGLPPGPGGFVARLSRRMEERPGPLDAPPAYGRAALGAGLVFTLGHSVEAWPAAAAYFALTTALYRKTRSLRACMLAHAAANLGVAALVQAGPGMRFLWY